MSPKAKTDVEGFLTIDRSVSLFRPQESSNASAGGHESPALIVLCSWMGAAAKHIAKYTKAYQQLYPRSAILLVQSSPADVMASDSKLSPRMTVACETILSYKTKDPASGPIVLHAMSNGGGTAARRIAEILHSRGQEVVLDKLILECAPGAMDVGQAVNAFEVTLPKNPIIRLIGRLLLWIWLRTTLFSVVTIQRREDPITILRRRLNDGQVFNLATPRLYVYSKGDAVVMHEDVHSHAEDAKQKGFKSIQEVVFDKAPHCGLITENATRYSGTITAFLAGTA